MGVHSDSEAPRHCQKMAAETALVERRGSGESGGGTPDVAAQRHEIWSYVGSEATPSWIWLAMEAETRRNSSWAGPPRPADRRRELRLGASQSSLQDDPHPPGEPRLEIHSTWFAGGGKSGDARLPPAISTLRPPLPSSPRGTAAAVDLYPQSLFDLAQFQPRQRQVARGPVEGQI